MLVRKVRGQDKVGKITLTPLEMAVARKLNLPLEEYVKQLLLFVAKKRRWKWYFSKEKNNDT